MAIPNIFPFPIRQVPTWIIINADDPLSLPLMGQFTTPLTWSGGKPIWSEEPSIAGGSQWLQYVGTTTLKLQFEFHGIANDNLDFYPSIGWNRLKDLAARDESLGRPPLVWFLHGFTLVQGYITDVGDAEIKYWQGSSEIQKRFIREVGPVSVTITVVPGKEAEVSLSTSYEVLTALTLFEELAAAKFKSADYAASLREYNQGKLIGEELEIPRLQNPNVSKIVSVCPYFDIDGAIEGM